MGSNYIPEAMPGSPITAEDWNALRKAVLRSQVHVDPTSGMDAHQDEGGITLGVNRAGIIIYKATGTISARSGTTPGYGNAQIVSATHSSLANTIGVTVVVHNLVTSTVASGKYGLGGMDENGLHWAVFEC